MSPKVIDFCTNRKRICDFLLVINSNFGSSLHRFWDTATDWLKIAHFLTSLLFGAPVPYLFPLEFRGEVNHEETRVMGLWWKLHDPNFKRFWLIHPCDRQTDGRTDGRSYIARYDIGLYAYKR